jgi:hypothetical protein
MASENRRRFLAPNAGTLRDPTSNAKEHNRNRNPPRFMEMGGASSAKKMINKNDKRLTGTGDVV